MIYLIVAFFVVTAVLKFCRNYYSVTVNLWAIAIQWPCEIFAEPHRRNAVTSRFSISNIDCIEWKSNQTCSTCFEITAYDAIVSKDCTQSSTIENYRYVYKHYKKPHRLIDIFDVYAFTVADNLKKNHLNATNNITFIKY